MAKFKIKTKKSASKRFKILASGKIKRAKKNKQHILTKKKRKRKNKLKKTDYIHASDRKRILRCMPNG